MHDTHSVTTDGDTLVVETPFGEARFDLADANAAANDDIRGDKKWPDDFGLEERWSILTDEVEMALSMWQRGEL